MPKTIFNSSGYLAESLPRACHNSDAPASARIITLRMKYGVSDALLSRYLL